jgi:aminopeptidase-like protein
VSLIAESNLSNKGDGQAPFPAFDVPEIDPSIYQEIYRWAADLFPICRSLTGSGVRETLSYFKTILPRLNIHEVPTGTHCFDWIVPEEWTIRDAYIVGPDGKRFAEFKRNNLHVLGYSAPVDEELTLEELQPHLYSSEDQPNAIPYITSYYTRRWGFCIAHNERQALKSGKYRAVIDSTLAAGSFTYADLVLPGESADEILLTSYVCHPSMANNELSGPIVLVALARWLQSLPRRRYTYRIVLAPETLGSIVYLSRHFAHMKKHVRAGYVVTCVGDDRSYSFLPSRLGDTLADRAARHAMLRHAPHYKEYSFLDRGSDERQYCFPTVDLPVASVMRSKYDTYPEYHSSLDNLDFISPTGLGGGYEIYRKIIHLLEVNSVFAVTTICEPRLGIHNLYPDLSRKETSPGVVPLINFMAFADGKNDIITISDRINVPVEQCIDIAHRLYEAGLLRTVSPSGASAGQA